MVVMSSAAALDMRGSIRNGSCRCVVSTWRAVGETGWRIVGQIEIGGVGDVAVFVGELSVAVGP